MGEGQYVTESVHRPDAVGVVSVDATAWIRSDRGPADVLRALGDVLRAIDPLGVRVDVMVPAPALAEILRTFGYFGLTPGIGVEVRIDRR